jgi:hypothetical protein
LYNKVKPVPGALDVVNELRRLGHEIVYITACCDLQTWLAKATWLEREGFLLSRDQAFPVGLWAEYKSKREAGQRNGVQVLVDDSITNCHSFDGVAFLLTQPHNRQHIYTGKRLKTFNQLVSEIKFMNLKPVDLQKESFMQVIEENRQLSLFDIGSKPTNPKDAIALNKVPLHFVSGIVKAYQAIAHYLGNVKYGAWNYRAGGARASIYKAALDRHMDRWWEGEEADPVDGTPHLANALACINILIECSEGGNLVDDRPPSRIGVLQRVYKRFEDLMPLIRERYKDKKPKHYSKEDAV